MIVSSTTGSPRRDGTCMPVVVAALTHACQRELSRKAYHDRRASSMRFRRPFSMVGLVRSPRSDDLRRPLTLWPCRFPADREGALEVRRGGFHAQFLRCGERSTPKTAKRSQTVIAAAHRSDRAMRRAPTMLRSTHALSTMRRAKSDPTLTPLAELPADCGARYDETHRHAEPDRAWHALAAASCFHRGSRNSGRAKRRGVFPDSSTPNVGPSRLPTAPSLRFSERV